MKSVEIKVVIIDDHDLFREGLVAILAHDPRIHIVGQGSTSDDALRLSRDERPDVLLLDVEIPGCSAETSIHTINRLDQPPSIIVLTMHRDAVLRRSLLRAGATDYLPKTIDHTRLLDSIDRALTVPRPGEALGGFYLDQSAGPVSHKELLSDRELEVLRLIAQAQSNRDIGRRLSIAEGTVKRHTTNLYAKLGAISRIDAVRRASRLGLLPSYRD